VTPGFTRALVIVQPEAVAVVDESERPGDVVLIPMNAGEDPVHFDVFLERPGANLASWPGKNAMGTVLVGRGPLAGGAGTCCVVARQADVSGQATLPRPDPDEVERMKADIARGDRYMTLFAMQPDGAMALIDGRAELA